MNSLILIWICSSSIHVLQRRPVLELVEKWRLLKLKYAIVLQHFSTVLILHFSFAILIDFS